MDDRGYLIVHRHLIDPSERMLLEEQHITRREPLVSNDILNHVGFVKKKTCNNYLNRTIQRSYQVNTHVYFELATSMFYHAVALDRTVFTS